MILKACTKCLTPKTLDCFHDSPLGKHGKQSICRDCARAFQQARYKDPTFRANKNAGAVKRSRAKHATDPVRQRIYSMLKSARKRARDENLAFDLDANYLASIVTDKCPALGLPFNWALRENARTGPAADSPSLDRFRADLGYVQGNVHVISHLANKMKNSGTPDQIRSLSRWVTATEALFHIPDAKAA